MTEDAEPRRSQTAYFAIRDLVVEGKMEPGEPLVESRLAALIGVSRTPVREAFALLEADGLVAPGPNGRRVVMDLWNQVEDVLPIRQRLEGLAAALAAEMASARELDELRDLQLQMEHHLEHGDEPDVEELIFYNRKFHVRIIELAKNQTLLDISRRLAPFSASPRILSRYSDEDLRTAIYEHREIIDALWHRDGERADRLLSAHLSRAVDAIRQSRSAERDPKVGPSSSAPD